MDIARTFNTTKEEIESKKFDILIPICVGNKFFLDGIKPTDNISNYISWALENTKNKVLILIADKIQISNWIVRNSRVSPKKNLKRLMKRGEEIKANIIELIKNKYKNKKNKIEVLRWEDYYKEDAYCKETTEIVYNEFKINEQFRKSVYESVKNSVTDRPFTKEEYLIFCNYVLDEFSVVYHGVKINGDYYGLYAYPDTDEVLELIEKIKSKEIFLDLENKLPRQKISVILMK